VESSKKKIKGIKRKKEIKLSLFADDIIVRVKNMQNSEISYNAE
jgi:hypothetical protein